MIVCIVLGGLLLAWPITEAGPCLLDAYEGYRDFPVIAKFQTEREVRRWGWRQAEVHRIIDPEHPGDWMGRIDFLPGTEAFPTATIDPIHRDFRGYSWLYCSFEVIGGPLQITISLRGGPLVEGHTSHVQFSHRFEPGSHIMRMALPELENRPEGESLDLGDVRTIQWYVVRPAEVRSILLRQIWLEK